MPMSPPESHWTRLVPMASGDYSNVVGLPIARLVRELASLIPKAGDLVADAITIGGPHA